LETIYFLSLYPPNRTQMIKNEFLLPKVKALMSNGKTGEIVSNLSISVVLLVGGGDAAASSNRFLPIEAQGYRDIYFFEEGDGYDAGGA
jgi:hypothetical protein